MDGYPLSTMQLLEEPADTIRNAGGNVIALEMDVTCEEHLSSCIAEATGAFGDIEILVNNAGTTIGTGPFLNATPAQWQTSFEVNLMAPAHLAQLAIPLMKEAGGGAIINVGSTGNLGAEAGFGADTAMKHGIIGLTKRLPQSLVWMESAAMRSVQAIS